MIILYDVSSKLKFSVNFNNIHTHLKINNVTYRNIYRLVDRNSIQDLYAILGK